MSIYKGGFLGGHWKQLKVSSNVGIIIYTHFPFNKILCKFWPDVVCFGINNKSCVQYTLKYIE